VCQPGVPKPRLARFFYARRASANAQAEGIQNFLEKEKASGFSNPEAFTVHMVVDGSPLNNFLFALKHAGEC
jgi:uncharacterized protein YehS (DUF1456 family)